VIRRRLSEVTWYEDHQVRTVALNVGGRYIGLAFELVLGLVMLPINTRYLGQADYGLWMLATSIVAYFPVLELGYGGAMERFVAHYRARRNAEAINEIASTLVFVFAAIGLGMFVVVAIASWHLGSWFDLTPEQARVGSIVLVLVAAQFALGLPFAIFGAVVNGFQRTYLNSIVGTTVAFAVGAVNLIVVFGGGGLLELVAALTATRLLGFAAYRLTAYRVFPLLRIRPSLFRLARLREVTRFSVYMLIQDAASRMNYATDPMVIAAVLSTGAVAIWTVAQRLADAVTQLTSQLNDVLFPIVVDCDTAQLNDRLRDLLVQGTRLSLATAFPLVGTLAILAEPVVVGWTGPEFRAAAVVVQVLGLVVLLRVGSDTASMVLRGAGHHRLLAVSNSIAASVNLGLSILLIRSHGLPGVAFATLLPTTIRAIAVLIPVACARVGLSVRRFVATAVWPALWPAVLVLGGLALVRDNAGPSLGRAFLHGGLVGFVYIAVFVAIAIGREDRKRYIGKLRSIARWPVLETA
jgi:O-antigen/teichoic acid export membrane protein